MGLFRRRSRWEGVDFGALQPEQCVDFQEDGDDAPVTLLVPRFRSGPLARWLQPRLRPERAHIRVSLENRGSWVWRQCDGQRTVVEIAADFTRAFPTEQDQIEKRICQYLYQLEDNGFIRFRNLG